MRHFLLALLLLLFVLISSASAADVDVAAIQSLVTQRNDYFNAQEYEKLVPLFAKEKQASRAEGIAKQKDKWKAKSITTSNQTVESVDISGDKATALHRFELNGAKKVERISFVREADGWKIEDITQ